MSEIAAKSKFACPSCGGEAVWNAGKRALVCAFCGTVAPMELPVEGGEGIVEHDLVRALQGIGGGVGSGEAIGEVSELPSGHGF